MRTLPRILQNRVRIPLLVLLLLISMAGLLTSSAPAVYAQDYSFSVPEMHMDVTIQKDASVRIVYDITFQNNPGAHPIDIVDIGTPTSDYSFNTMQASIDGQPLTTIRTSEYIDVGVEIHLNQHAIASGQSGTLHFEFTMPDMVYQDTTRDDYASMQITPTWFDDDLVTGNGTIRLTVATPSGIQPEEVLYQDERKPFTEKQMIDDRVVVAWQWSDTRATSAHEVGLSFPKRSMDRVVEMSTVDLFFMWLEDNPQVLAILAAIVLLGGGFVLYKIAGARGCVVIGMVVAGIIFLCTNPGGIFFVIFIGSIVLGVIEDHKRKDKYLPAIAQVEGGGIKRGLTAAEAGVILEIPPNKVLMLVLFGMLKKNILRQTQTEPLVVEVTDAFKDKDKNERLKAAQQIGVVMHTYEHDFLEEIEKNPGKPVHKINFKEPMKKLVKHAAKRVKGFDLSDTQDYYRRIIKKAMEQAKEMGDVPEFERNVDRNLEWILMNKDYDTTFDTRPGYRYRPVWTRPTPVIIGGGSGGGVGSSGSSGGGDGGGSGGGGDSGGGVSFGDVSASFAGWFENTTGQVADTISPASLGTAPKPPPSSRSSGGGGGCACACAGCACACACAGGGR